MHGPARYRVPPRYLLPLLFALPLAATAQSSASLEPRVRFETTAGDFVLQLDTVRAPITAENFLRYVRDGHYDGLLVHRVVPNFVVQTGGYDAQYAERPTRAAIPNESGNGLSNRRGSVGMARGESPHSATSQFYINLKDNAGLNPLPSRWGYAVFGEVVEGMEVIDRIAHVPTGERGPFGTDAPLETILVERATVVGETGTTPATPLVPSGPATGSGSDGGGTEQPAGSATDPQS